MEINNTAKLTIEYNDKVIGIWKLEFPDESYAQSDFRAIDMGYYNGTLLQALCKIFDKQEKEGL